MREGSFDIAGTKGMQLLPSVIMSLCGRFIRHRFLDMRHSRADQRTISLLSGKQQTPVRAARVSMGFTNLMRFRGAALTFAARDEERRPDGAPSIEPGIGARDTHSHFRLPGDRDQVRQPAILLRARPILMAR